jgi:site-specific DNA recombinase
MVGAHGVATAYKGEVYPGEHQPLIERAVWDRVQERLRAGATIRPSARKKSLASLFKCGLCGGFMMRNGTGKRPDAQGRYVCHAAENLPREERHERVSAAAPKAEAAVWAYVEWLFRGDVLQQAAEKHLKRLAAKRKTGATTKARKRLDEIDRAVSRNLRAFQLGAIDEELLTRENKGLLDEKARLKRSLEEAETPPAFREALERLSGLSPEETIADLRKAPADRQLAVLRLLFEKVEVFPGKLVFHHQGALLPPATIPLPKLYAPKRGLGEIVIPSDPYFATYTSAIQC